VDHGGLRPILERPWNSMAKVKEYCGGLAYDLIGGENVRKRAVVLRIRIHYGLCDKRCYQILERC
jgi:hypothetical protein